MKKLPFLITMIFCFGFATLFADEYKTLFNEGVSHYEKREYTEIKKLY